VRSYKSFQIFKSGGYLAIAYLQPVAKITEKEVDTIHIVNSNKGLVPALGKCVTITSNTIGDFLKTEYVQSSCPECGSIYVFDEQRLVVYPNASREEEGKLNYKQSVCGICGHIWNKYMKKESVSLKVESPGSLYRSDGTIILINDLPTRGDP
jgi:hypothetical protein